MREAFTFLGVEVGQIDPISIWEKHLHTLVPSPEGTGSYYRGQALWMKALSEVNRTAYKSCWLIGALLIVVVGIYGRKWRA